MSPHPTNPVMPHFVVSDGAGAIDWYAKAFNAKELQRSLAEDGKRILHAAVEINGAVVMLCDDFPEWTGGSTPEKFGGTPVTMHVELNAPGDVDAWCERAKSAGAAIEMGPEDMFWGDRYAKLKDPYGHSWSFGASLPAGDGSG